VAQAEDLIRRWLEQATAGALEGLRQVAEIGQPRPLPPLERILSSHPLLHAAEGQLSREAAASAAEAHGLGVFHVPPEEGADAAITVIVAEIGRAAGPPWRPTSGTRPR
jgi:hypothetical protein